MKKIIFFSLIFFILPTSALNSQDIYVYGKVLCDSLNLSLIGATINWAGSDAYVIAGENGRFSIPVIEHKDSLVVRFIGYVSDTVKVTDIDEEIIFRLITDTTTICEGIICRRVELNSFLDNE
ncbi:MAG: carboxypeptidase-like regulatory domain-containing protein [Rikenellaceae bacterium]|nr:carboxypeptidase-like regulatory domain-containing protein [Rikenellaceae bacterium]